MSKPLLFAFCTAAVLCGCRPPDITYHTVARMPDIAKYSGVYFESQDDLESYDSITIIPRRLTTDVKVILPDGVAVDPSELLREYFKQHQLECIVDGGDGQSSYNLTFGELLFVFVREKKVDRVVIRYIAPRPSNVQLEMNGHRIQLPIARPELEALLGKPDEIHRRTAPEGEFAQQK